jgi:putative transposase
MLLMDATLAVRAKIGNVSQWCRANGVDRRTFYRHRARIEAEGGWAPRSRRPKSSPHATPEPVAAEIVRLRRALAPDNGADPIRDALAALAAEQGWAARGWRVPSRATVNRILAREGLAERNPRKRPKSSLRRFAYARPRDCYQIDATEVVLAGGAKAVVFDVLDDCTRTLVACLAAPAETADAAIAAITAAAHEHGEPAIVLCDNGSAFTSRPRNPSAGPSGFTRTVTGWGSRIIHSSPYHPQTCGKVERHHQTLKRWLACQPPPATLADLQTLLDAYRARYNHRPHSALDRATPHQAWTAAEHHGGPEHLPVQAQGLVQLGRNARIRIGTAHAGHAVTVIRDGDRATAYTSNGDPLGHIHLDHAKRYQGPLTPAA